MIAERLEGASPQTSLIYLYILLLFLLLIVESIYIQYYDVQWWEDWVRIADEKGILYVYSAPKAGYPPIPILLYVALRRLIRDDMFLFNVVAKTVFVVVPALVVALIVERESNAVAALLWLLSAPLAVVLLVPQFDVIAALFFTLSVRALTRKRYALSAVFLALSALVKQYLALALIIPAIVLGIRSRDFAKYLAVFVSVTALCFGPFLAATPQQLIEKVLLFHAGRAPQELSLWALPLAVLGVHGIGVKAYSWIWILQLIIVLCVLYRVSRSFLSISGEAQPEALWRLSALTLLLLVIASKVVGLNYAAWCLPPVLISLSNPEQRSSRRIALVYSLALWAVAAFCGISTLYEYVNYGGYVFLVEDEALWSYRLLEERNILVQDSSHTELSGIPMSVVLLVGPVSSLLKILIFNAASMYVIYALARGFSAGLDKNE